MSTINQELLDLLQEEIGTGKTQIYWHVTRKREVTGLPRAQAALALAMELGIEVQKYATAYDLEMIKEVEPGLHILIEEILPDKSEIAKSIEDSQKTSNGRNPFLNPKLINNAHKNAEICSMLFLFENSIRRLVHTVMEKKHGIDWWYDAAPKDIMYATFDRRAGENGPKWRAQFGAEPIYYTDIKDLSEIINVHQDIFSKVYGDEIHLDRWVHLVERVRAGLTFTNPVTLKDRNKFLAIIAEWNEIAKKIHKNLED